MRPYRYRALPKERKPVPVDTEFVEVPKPEVVHHEDVPPANQNILSLLATLLQPSMQPDMQKLLSFLPPQFQAIANTAASPENSGAQMPGSARVMAALSGHQSSAYTPPKHIVEALKNSGAAKHPADQPGKASDAVESLDKMRQTMEQIGNQSPSTFLSKQLEARLKEQAQGKGPLVEMLINKQPPSPASLMPSLMKNNANPLMSMLMQGGQNPLASMLIGSGQNPQTAMPTGSGQNPLLSMLMGNGQNPLASMMTGGGQNPLASMMTGGGQNPLASMMTGSGQNPLASMMTGSGQNPLLSMMMGGGQNPLLSMMMGGGQNPLAMMLMGGGQNNLLQGLFQARKPNN